MTQLPNPGQPGAFAFDTVVYASAGNNYAAVPALNDYHLFDAPNPAYVTGRVDISAFANLGTAPWPFANTNVPLNGQVCIPRGRGPFPMALFVHGNHGPLQNSTPGYLYLCQLLASQGIIAGTIDANFLNGGIFGENDARAIVHLEHVKLFRNWDGQAGHPLMGRVDLTRVMIIGHSRGGEGVGHASLFNRLNSVVPVVAHPPIPLDGSAGLGPYHFGLVAAIAIAPTDRQYQPVDGPTVVPDNYFLIHGSRDGDVSDFEGYNTFNRAHRVDTVNATVGDNQRKALLWAMGANHNHFNSVWPTEGAPTITRAEQEQVARVFIGTIAAAMLQDQRPYLDVLRDHSLASAWMPAGINLVSQHQQSPRIFLMHNQESLAGPQISLPVQGTVIADSVTTSRQFFNLVNAFQPPTQITLQLKWAMLGARFALAINPATLPAERYNGLAIRVGQAVDPPNAPSHDQDFTIEISSGSRTAGIPASSVHRLLYPDLVFGSGKTVMQTLFVAREKIEALGIEPSDIRSVAFVFDRRASGTIFVGDIQLTD